MPTVITGLREEIKRQSSRMDGWILKPSERGSSLFLALPSSTDENALLLPSCELPLHCALLQPPLSTFSSLPSFSAKLLAWHFEVLCMPLGQLSF